MSHEQGMPGGDGPAADLRGLLGSLAKTDGTVAGRVSAVLLALTVPLLLWFVVARGAFDFDCYWVGSWAVRDHAATQMYSVLDEPNAQGQYDLANPAPAWNALSERHLGKDHTLWGFIYPPPCAAFFVPMTFLPRTIAIIGWRLLNLVAYLAGVLMLLTLVRSRLTSTALRFLLALALASPPLLVALGIGQITPIVFFTVAAGLYFLATDRPVAAGVWLAVGTLIKLTPGLFAVWLLARRQYRAFAAWCGGMAILSLLTLPVTGTSAFVRFFTHCMPLLSRGAVSSTNVSLVGEAGRLLGLGDPHSALILPPDSRLTAIKLGFSGFIILVSAFALWRPRRTEFHDSLVLEYALVNMAALLLSPITWGHHLMLATVALIPAAAIALSRRDNYLAGAAGLSYALLMLHGDLLGRKLPEAVSSIAPLIGMLLLWGVVCLLLLTPRQADAVAEGA